VSDLEIEMAEAEASINANIEPAQKEEGATDPEYE
jgi:hypothetical protein